MELSDDGKLLVMTSKPWLVSKIFAALFGLLAVVMSLVAISLLVLPVRQATLACDRSAGTCSFGDLAPIAIADLTGAEVKHSGASDFSPGRRLLITTKAGGTIQVAKPSYHQAITSDMRRAADGLNAFLANPGQPSFSASFVANDTNWMGLVPLLVLSPIAAYYFLRAWSSRRLEVDRATRRLRLQVKRRVGGTSDETFAPGEVTSLLLVGFNWGRLLATTSRGPRTLVVVPRTPLFARELISLGEKVAAGLGVELAASKTFRRAWNMRARGP